VAIDLTTAERRDLQSLAPAHQTLQAMAQRARTVPAAASRLENKAICAEVRADASTLRYGRGALMRSAGMGCSTSRAPARCPGSAMTASPTPPS
jgi:hypothetical protein